MIMIVKRMFSFKSVFLIIMSVLILCAFIFYNNNYKFHVINALFNPIQSSCDLKTNILFLKTHKTASTTVQNILYRFAEKYQRLVAIYPPIFEKFNKNSLIDLKPGYNYSVFASHAILNYKEMRAVMPEDTKFITILRDPVSLVESGFVFAKFELFFGINISAFANLNISDPKVAKLIKTRLLNKFGCNQMAFDLGIDPTLFDNLNDILEKVEELDKQFDLVMIAELFDQSLILLKEKMCWKDLNDVISFKVNVRKARSKARLSSEQTKNLRRMNQADQLIYDHFYQKLLRQIDAFGKEKMEEEVVKLREATKKMYDFCIDTEINDGMGSWSTSRLVLRKEAEIEQVCQDLIKDDVSFTLDVFAKQKQYYADSAETIAALENTLRIVKFLSVVIS